MAIYTPPQGDNTNFELGLYLAPQGDAVNFELLESVGNQIVVWDDVGISEFSAITFQFNYHPIVVYDEIFIVEDVSIARDPQLLTAFDISSIAENLSAIVDPLIINEEESFSILEDFNVALDVLSMVLYEDISIAEYATQQTILLPVVADEILVVEEVFVVDLVIEVWDASDEVAVSEYTNFIIFPPRVQSFQEVSVLDVSNLGLDPTYLFKFESFVIAEFASVAPYWYWTGELFDSIGVTDVLDRILVGHFPYPIEYVSVQESLEIERFPPYPFPKEFLSVSELVGFSMNPPSLSWIAQYITAVEYLVVGQDPHYANLGFQNIYIAEVPILYPNPLYIAVQDLADVVPTVRDWARWSVGFPVNVKEDVITADELTAFYISELLPPLFLEHIGHDEQVWLDTTPHGLWSAIQSVTVTENIQIVLSVIPLSIVQSITATEQFYGWTGQEIFPFDVATVTESVTVSVDPLVISKYEVSVVTETVTVRFAPRAVSVFDEVTVTEDFDYFVGYAIAIYDAVTVSESFSFGLTPLQLSISDSVIASEFTSLVFPIYLSVWQFIETNENVKLTFSVIPLPLIYEQVEVSENVAFQFVLLLSAYDEVFIAESLASFFSAWNLYTVEDIVATEGVYVLGLGGIYAWEDITVQETPLLSPDILFSFAYDDITVAEFIEANNYWDLFAYDEVTALDITELHDLVIDLGIVLEEIFIVEDATILTLDILNVIGIETLFAIAEVLTMNLPQIFVYDWIGVVENVTLTLPYFSVFENIEIDEWTYIQPPPLVSIYEDISVQEWARQPILDPYALSAFDDLYSFEDVFVRFDPYGFSVYDSATITDYGETIILWLINAYDSIGVADLGATVSIGSVGIFAIDYVMTLDFSFIEDLTRFIFAVDSFSITEHFFGSGLSIPLSVFDSIVVYELAYTGNNVLFVFTDEQIFIQETIVPELLSYIDVYESVLAIEEIETSLLFLISVFDSLTAVDVPRPALNPNPVSIYETIGVVEQTFVRIDVYRVEVYETLGPISEWVSLFADSNYYRTIYEQVGISESVQVKVITTVFAFQNVAITEYVTWYFDKLLLVASEQVTVIENVSVQHILLVKVSESLSIIDLASIYDGVSLIAVYEDFGIIEDVVIQTTGIAVYPHDNIFKVEWVSVYLDSLNLFAFDSAIITENLKVDDFIIAMEFLTVQESISASISQLFASVSDSISVSESASLLLYTAGTLPVIVLDSIGVEDISNQYLNVLWTGIQTDFIATQDVMVDYLVGILVEASEDVSVDEDLTAQIGALFLSVYDLLELRETGWAWFYQAEALFNVEFVLIQETLSVIIPELLVSVYDETSISEFADRIESFDLFAYDRADIFDDAEVFFPFFSVDIYEEVYASEYVSFGGLAIRVNAYEEVFIDEFTGMRALTLLVNVDDWVLISEYANFWDIELFVSDLTIISDYHLPWHIELFPKGFVAEQPIAVNEWARVEVQPISLFVSDAVSLYEFLITNTASDIFAFDGIGVSEFTDFLFFPPVLISRDLVSVLDWSYLEFEPWEIFAFSSVVSVKDVGWAYVQMGGQLTLTDFITVTEFLNMYLTGTGWYFGSAENTTIQEFVNLGLDPMPISIFDNVSVVELARVTDLIVELFADDSLSVTEWTYIALGILPIEVSELLNLSDEATLNSPLNNPISETLTVSESPELYIPIGLNVLDLVGILDVIITGGQLALTGDDIISVTDYSQVVLDALMVSVLSDATIVEQTTCDLLIGLSVFDSGNVGEISQAFLTELFLSALDSVSIGEIAGTLGWPVVWVDESVTAWDIALASVSPLVVVEDSIATAESFEFWFDVLLAYGVESILAGEWTWVSLNILLISRDSGVFVEDSAETLLPELVAETNEAVSISEDGGVSLDTIVPFATDSVVVSEFGELFFPVLTVVLDESVLAIEFADLYLPLAFSVESEVLLEESASVWDIVIELGVFDTVAIDEWFGQTREYLISVRESLTVQDYAVSQVFISISRFEEVNVFESVLRDIRINVSLVETVAIEEGTELVWSELFIFVFSLEAVSDACYTILDYNISIYDRVSTNEWFVWGLPIQYIFAFSEVAVAEERGVYIEPYLLFPILFDSPERGG